MFVYPLPHADPSGPSAFLGQQDNDIPGLGDLIPGLGGELPATSPENSKISLPFLSNEPLSMNAVKRRVPPLPAPHLTNRDLAPSVACETRAPAEPQPVPPPSVPPSSVKSLMEIDTGQVRLAEAVTALQERTFPAETMPASSTGKEFEAIRISESVATPASRRIPLSERLMDLADYSVNESSKNDRIQLPEIKSGWLKHSTSESAVKEECSEFFDSRRTKNETLSSISQVDVDKQIHIPGLDVKSDSDVESDIPPKSSSSPLPEVLCSPNEEAAQDVSKADSGEEGNDDIAMTAMRAQLILGMKLRQERKIQQLDVSNSFPFV